MTDRRVNKFFFMRRLIVDINIHNVIHIPCSCLTRLIYSYCIQLIFARLHVSAN